MTVMYSPPQRFVLIAALIFAVLPLGGCFRPVNRWSYNKPPDALNDGAGPRGVDPDQHVMVIGTFRDPPATSVPIPEVGLAFTRAMQQALLNEAIIDVWHNDALAQDVIAVLQGPTHERKSRLQSLYAEYDGVRFVMNGIVTDFTHTREVPAEVRRWDLLGGLFGGRKEALVAIRFTIVDLEVGRLIVSDHIYGWHQAGRKSVDKLYADIAFGTYLYWNSPLGHASEDVIGDMLVKVDAIVPTGDKAIRIIKVLNRNEVRLSSVPVGAMPTNLHFHIWRVDPRTKQESVVADAQTGRPLLVRIRSGNSEKPTAWLIGVPEDTNLAGGILRPVNEQPTTVTAADAG
ncbi:MAG: hypothetical protein ACYTF9_05690 [Planctomycetota bacterium]